ncbi:MAG: hypothetical protein A4E33_00012 [Methanoregula sp. PtaB.Bin085]|nr:MAG: hypothetical protein A4E33_00012 [Methanoregula sp. PtaB.Bin085]
MLKFWPIRVSTWLKNAEYSTLMIATTTMTKSMRSVFHCRGRVNRPFHTEKAKKTAKMMMMTGISSLQQSAPAAARAASTANLVWPRSK